MAWPWQSLRRLTLSTRASASRVLPRRPFIAGFAVFVVDPSQRDQGAEAIRGYLITDQIRVNYLGFKKWVYKQVRKQKRAVAAHEFAARLDDRRASTPRICASAI